jgi:hypothetical protein
MEMLDDEEIADRCVQQGIAPATMASGDSIISSGKRLGAVSGRVDVEVH